MCWPGRWGGRGGSTSSRSVPERSPLSSAGAAVLRMSGDENPASKPTPVQDVQGDGRWMSLVSDSTRSLGVREVGASREPLLRGVLIFIWVGSQVLFVQPVQAGWGGAWSMRAIDSWFPCSTNVSWQTAKTRKQKSSSSGTPWSS